MLITANRQYYPLERVAGYWRWLVEQGVAGRVKIVEEVFDEFMGGRDNLAEWLRQDMVKQSLLFSEPIHVSLVRRVLSDGYAPDLNDLELEQIGQDPFLIAHALSDRTSRIVVTLEVSKPGRTRANRHVPDVCRTLGVRCVDPFAMASDLDFRI